MAFLKGHLRLVLTSKRWSFIVNLVILQDMAVLGCSIPIASFYCRQQYVFCCFGDTPKFGDFNSITLPHPVEELQVKDALLKVMDRIYKVQRRKVTLDVLVIALCFISFFMLPFMHKVLQEYVISFLFYFILFSSLSSLVSRRIINCICQAIVEESNPQCK